MIRLLAAGALCLSLYCSAPAAYDSSLYEDLTDCIDLQFELEQDPDSYSEIDLAADCPELLLSLADNAWVDRISLADPDYPSLAQLADLRFFLLGIYNHPDTPSTLDFARLESILAETLVAQDDDRERGWWERLLDWLKQRYKDRDDVELDWLEGWLEKLTLSDAAAERITYGVAILMVLLAAGFIINEVRLARQENAAPRSRNNARRGMAEPASLAGETLPDAQPLPRKVPELLNACIDYLIRNRRLPEARSRTNREFLRHLRHAGDSAAPGFDHLLQQAECVLYGDRAIDTQTLQQCRREAADLLGIDDPTPPAAATPG